MIVGHEEGTVEKTGLGKHSHNDCRILYATHLESKMEGWIGIKDRLLDGWIRRLMKVEIDDVKRRGERERRGEEEVPTGDMGRPQGVGDGCGVRQKGSGDGMRVTYG